MLSVVFGTGERAEITVEIAEDCPLGIYGFRLATEHGLSNCLLLAVDELEPRTVTNRTLVSLPIAISGGFRKGEVDRFTNEVVAGQTLAFETIAARLGTEADPLFTIYDSSGKRMVQHDNDPGLLFDSRFEHNFAEPGKYELDIFHPIAPSFS